MKGKHQHNQPKLNNNLQPPIYFFCKDCEKIVETKPVGRKFVYKCNVCGTKNVAFGTLESLKNFYRYQGEEAEKQPSSN
ncbi:hypothetical protein GF340_03450 [Candidatus Peregrinibacteria bacterium]|nr:hypothetical protein [Candidatus Peregrinibacteria bacterium]